MLIKYLVPLFAVILLRGAATSLAEKITFSIKRPKLSDIDLINETMTLRLGCNNASPLELPVQAVKGDLYRNGTKLGRFATNQINNIPANSSKIINVTTVFDIDNTPQYGEANILESITSIILGESSYTDPIIFKGHIFIGNNLIPVEKVLNV